MNARSLLIVVAALLVAGVTAFLARGWLTAERAQIQTQQVVVKEVPAQAVLVAAASLPIGLFIKEEHLRWQAWPSDNVDPNYLLQDKTDLATLVGSVVRRTIAAGEPIIAGKVVKPGDRGFLAAVLKPGMRAVTFGISETSAVAGMVFPGDRVDMLLTHDLPGGGNEGEARRASETVLENVRVLAIGHSLNENPEGPVSAKTATIEVTPKQAEMVAVLVELGRLSLALRSLSDEEAEASGRLLMSSSAPDAESALPIDAPAGEAPEAGADAATPALPMDDNPAATRGQTYTYDSEVSRLLAPGGVVIQRGNQSEQVTFQ